MVISDLEEILDMNDEDLSVNRDARDYVLFI